MCDCDVYYNNGLNSMWQDHTFHRKVSVRTNEYK